ncbi:hypothetical protein E1A91_D02G175100v1 [Gossypium mustelinum]|nr:hypothetical protein E1A91_D10G083600v1 [Gossypium mustelinum]TYI94025.1 hypothetical protein E1A91_D02G175100v1 [Gossypium mustelinum]TYI94026.1 hypothetical protein E1A91_D02G175100v1 [Gossypium mustelinum]TYI94027.1 hypothetical protein E1A91_D02G175100v1 [Gossypium mustelinum]TYI94028.1 hypothetical protein E1A91_D02G175100v1 [Gossypium mustelinum]
MQEGLANILLVGKSMTSTRSRIETSIPRKHGPAIAGYESALKKFFENVLQAFLKHVDFNVVRCAVIASPGFTKDQFHRHLMLEAERRQRIDNLHLFSCIFWLCLFFIGMSVLKHCQNFLR